MFMGCLSTCPFGPTKCSKGLFLKVLKHHNFDITGQNESNFPGRGGSRGCGGTTKALSYLDTSLDIVA